MNDLTILGALQDIAKDITEPQPRLIIYNDIVGVPHTFIGLLGEGGNEILRGFAPEVTALKGKGKIFNENGHEYSSKIVISISKEQTRRFLSGKIIATAVSLQINALTSQLLYNSTSFHRSQHIIRHLEEEVK